MRTGVFIDNAAGEWLRFRKMFRLPPKIARLALGMRAAMVALAAATATTCAAQSSEVRGDIGSPLDMARELSRLVASGAGCLMPGEEPYVAEQGIVPLATSRWPAEFVAGLAPREIFGLVAYPVEARLDDATGAAVFSNAEGTPFHAVWPSGPRGAYVPILTTDQEKKAIVSERNKVLTGVSIRSGNKIIISGPGYLSCLTPQIGRRADFFEYTVGGDSGSPRFLLKGSELLLLNSTRTSSYGDGSLLSEYIDDVMQAVQSLYSDYTITVDDWSVYPKRVHKELR